MAVATPVLSQSITVDGSTNTTLSTSGVSCSGDCSISGGITSVGRTSNLFHSFSNFNVDTGAVVTFEDPGVSNIFGRVTGNSLTSIDGTLKVDGAANLFLLNPNGIIFGDQASLDIQGSFLSTTANSILFEENKSFGVSSTDNQSLLSVSIPLGLQFGSSPGPITVNGNGHALAYDPRTFTINGSNSSGLIAAPGQTLALIGGEISLQGGNLVSEGGVVEVGGVREGTVGLSTEGSLWDFDYSNIASFADVSLVQQASIDVSADDAGSVRVSGEDINILGGSILLAKVVDSGNGEIVLDASGDINVVGEDRSATVLVNTGAFVEIAAGAVGDGDSAIALDAENINISQGSQIGMGIAGDGTSGIVSVNAESVNLEGGSTTTPSSIYAIVLRGYTLGNGVGDGGDIVIDVDQLNLENGAQIAASTFGGGDAGDLTVNARDIRVVGRNDLNVDAVSSIRSASDIPPLGFVLTSDTPPVLRFPTVADGSGNSGTLTLNTERLLVSGAGQVVASTRSNNTSGSLVINASESVDLIGRDENGRSGLFASAVGDARVPVPSAGTAGSVEVNTQRLNILDGATINVSTQPSELNTGSSARPGEGAAGDIRINAVETNIKDGSLITADTVTGDRANITIQSDSLILRDGGLITTNATGTATGGNINIDAEALIAFENSDITANATDNFGGRIVVNSPTILGTDYRNQLTAESDITATSELGPAFSGSVELNSPEIDPTDGTVELPEGLNAEEQIIAACEKLDTNTFVATGRGGLPEGSGQLSTSQSLWNDFRLIERDRSVTVGDIRNEVDVLTADERASDHTKIVEARGWTLNNAGQVVLNSTSPISIASTHTASSCLRS